VAVVALVLAGLALRAGLRLRRRRQLRLGGDAAGRRRHLALAKPAVALVALAVLGGPLSSWLLRGWTPFERLHGWVGLCAAGLFIAAGVVGRNVEYGRRQGLDVHGWLGLAAVAAGALAFATGFVLLP
jgi:hypothetical protein